MNPADPREVGIKGAFFATEPAKNWKPSQFGHYPLHWYGHLMHCFEVVGFLRTPISEINTISLEIYERLVYNLHLYPENKTQLLNRLTEDRLAKGNIIS